MEKSIFCQEVARVKGVVKRFMTEPAPFNMLLWETHAKSILNAARYYEELVAIEKMFDNRGIKGKFTVVGKRRFEREVQKADFVEVEHMGRWVSIAYVCNFPGKTEWFVVLPNISSVVTEYDAW